jgi:peroxiredoxin
MKKTTILAAALAIAVAAAPMTTHASKTGAPAPAFKGTDSKGKVHNLSDFKGKWVVLEWHNEGCPYVKKHYGGNNMQQLQQEWTSKGVVWLTMLSSAAGQQGHMEPAQADAYFAQKNAAPSAILLDPSGEIGRLYDAKTTPHMFVINPDGMLVYNGAIDDKPTSDQADLAAASNYVSAALAEGMAGKAVTMATSRPYGCGIKYAR